jgi:hypothetical protein
MNEKVPQSLKEKQELMRQQTINAVIKAIHELQEQGYVIRIKDLMAYTGLSRSTFGKVHVREVLERYDVVEKKNIKEERVDSKDSLSIEKRLRKELKRKNERIGKLIEENTELKQECELLRGRLFLMMQRNE